MAFVRLLPVLLAATLIMSATKTTSAVSTAAPATCTKCCAFVRASVAFQRELAVKVKSLHGRRVYLFDSTGFSADFADAVTEDAVRYKTGVLDGVQVDAVLSVSARQALGVGTEAAATYYQWTGPAPDAVLDDFGVYI